MFTYTDMTYFEQAIRSLKLLKVVHDSGMDMSLFKDLTLYGDYNSPEGHSFNVLEGVMNKTFQNSEVYRFDYDYDKSDTLAILSYWLQKEDVEAENSRFSGIFVILDDRFDFTQLPKPECAAHGYQEYDYVHIPDGVVVLFGEEYEFVTDWSVVLRELMACERTKTTKNTEATEHEIAV